MLGVATSLVRTDTWDNIGLFRSAFNKCAEATHAMPTMADFTRSLEACFWQTLQGASKMGEQYIACA